MTHIEESATAASPHTARVVRTLALPSLLLLFWYLAADVFQIASPIVVPPPTAVGKAFWVLLLDGELFTHIAASLSRVAAGFAIGASLGIVVGVLMGLSRVISDYMEGVVNLLRPIPPLAWIPIAILWFGIGNTSSVFVVAYASFFPVLLNTITGVKGVDRILVRAAQSLGAGRLYVIVNVILPAALPSLVTGIRLSLALSWSSIVAAELIASQSGLGYMIEYYRRLILSDNVVVGMVTIGLIGLALDILLRALEERLVPWRTEKKM
jgi:sulfonate transport system permease protein